MPAGLDPPAAAADTVHGGLVHAFTVTAQAAPRGFVARAGGVVMAFTGSPIAFFNQILVTDGAADHDWHTAIQEARQRVPGYATHLRIGLDDHFERLARRTMRSVPGALTPGMIRDPLPGTPELAGLEVRSGPELLPAHIALVAEAFNLPVSAIESFMTPGIVGVPGLELHVGYAGGNAVATSFGLVHEQCVSIFNVATHPAHRGRGFGTAMTQAAIQAGRASGATVACLQSSVMGLPVYERLGFRTVVSYREMISGSGG